MQSFSNPAGRSASKAGGYPSTVKASPGKAPAAAGAKESPVKVGKGGPSTGFTGGVINGKVSC